MPEFVRVWGNNGIREVPVIQGVQEIAGSVSPRQNAAGNSGGVFYCLDMPVGVLGSATDISATGLVTGLTSLGATYPPVPVKMYCYAQAGLAAGFYYAVFSSATSCQLYSNEACTVLLSGITAGAYVGGTSEITLVSVNIPGGSIGNSGGIWVQDLWHVISSANTKTLRIKYGAAVFMSTNAGATITTSSMVRRTAFLNALGVVNKVGFTSNQYAGVSASPPTYVTVDSSVDQSFVVTAQNTSASETMILIGLSVNTWGGA